jgi:K+-sensing histidine kinase KdpD
MPSALTFDWLLEELRHLALTFLMVAVTCVVIFFIINEVGLTRGTVIFLVPVLIAASRWGLLSALFASLLGMLSSAFFFFPPLYSLRVRDPQEVINLLLYIVVAVVVSQLASRLKRELELAHRREIDLRDLYAFSRRLAGAFDAADIHAAIEDHLATAMQRTVALFASVKEAANGGNGRPTAGRVPERVLAEVVKVASGGAAPTAGQIVNASRGGAWLVRAVSPKNPEFGVIAIDLGGGSKESINDLRSRVDAILADATATLERLDIAHAIGEARMRAQTDHLREALIESVSHELRTPLASILGAATVLSAAPALAGEEKLKALVHDVRDEAERLNSDIQNLLDATRISSNGVTPHLEWAEPADIVNSAIERCRRRLAKHSLAVNLAPNLPLVHADPVLIQQALVQIFDNAVKYSTPGSSIHVNAQAREGRLLVSVTDQGCGLTELERERIWDRFVRGERHAAVAGSGLGLWIASAFVSANGGTLHAASAGVGRGTTMTVDLPATQTAVPQMESDEEDE